MGRGGSVPSPSLSDGSGAGPEPPKPSDTPRREDRGRSRSCALCSNGCAAAAVGDPGMWIFTWFAETCTAVGACAEAAGEAVGACTQCDAAAGDARVLLRGGFSASAVDGCEAYRREAEAGERAAEVWAAEEGRGYCHAKHSALPTAGQQPCNGSAWPLDGVAAPARKAGGAGKATSAA